MSPKFLTLAIPFLFVVTLSAGPADTVWTPLFDGSDLKNWDVKIMGHPLNWDSLNTFRVAPCVNDSGNCLELNYSNYTNWNGTPWGRIGYKAQTFSYYLLRAEYQLFGTQTPGTPSYSTQQSALLLHSQSMASMGLNQDWAITLEDQLVGPGNQVGASGTANLCTDGMAYHDSSGALITAHCTNAAANSMTLAPAWTSVSALVLGDSVIKYYAGAQLVLSFYRPVQRQDGNVHGNTVAIVDSTPVTMGTIAIQGEGAPIRFRRLEVANLAGCMDPASLNYKSYLVHSDPTACEVTSISSGVPAPNPMSFDALRARLALNSPGPYSLRLNDLSGKQIWESAGSGSRVFDLGRLALKGLYFLKLTQNGQTFAQKITLGY